MSSPAVPEGRNTARFNSNLGGAVYGGAPALFLSDSCNAGVGNTSFGDNLIPGPPVF